MSDMKPAETLLDFLKPPFTHDTIGMIFDRNGRLIDCPGHLLEGQEYNGEQAAKTRGWGIFQYYENGEELQDQFMDFICEALNFYYEHKTKGEQI